MFSRILQTGPSKKTRLLTQECSFRMFVDSYRWWQLKYVLFSPRILGEMIQFDQMA